MGRIDEDYAEMLEEARDRAKELDRHLVLLHQMFEDMIEEKDDEIWSLNDEIDELKDRIYQIEESDEEKALEKEGV